MPLEINRQSLVCLICLNNTWRLSNTNSFKNFHLDSGIHIDLQISYLTRHEWLLDINMSRIILFLYVIPFCYGKWISPDTAGSIQHFCMNFVAWCWCKRVPKPIISFTFYLSALASPDFLLLLHTYVGKIFFLYITEKDDAIH